jgi:endonuclease III
MEREKLIQEDYLDNPWKMLVCCILLNQTNNKQVRPILESVFGLIPDPNSAVGCDQESLASIIKTTGFQNVKASRIKKLSEKWIGGFDRVEDLPGIGKYGKESWDIFVNGNLDIDPTDKKLNKYLQDIR